MEIKVTKRDGSTEKFEEEKIARVVAAAGLEPGKAHEFAEKIAKWVKHRNKRTVSSLEIRDRVIKELKKTDDYAANLFVWYQKTKDGALDVDRNGAGS
jgi:transcriptional regulator NrdR family protein